MTFTYNKLLGKIIEVFGSQYNFAIAMGISERTLSLKLNGRRKWTNVDMKKAIELLKIPIDKIPEYFFENLVQ